MPLLSVLSDIRVYAEDNVLHLNVTYSLPSWRLDEKEPFTAICPSCRLLHYPPTLALLERGCWEILISHLLMLGKGYISSSRVGEPLLYVARCYNTLSRLYHSVFQGTPPFSNMLLLVEAIRSGITAVVRLYKLSLEASKKLVDMGSCGEVRNRFYTVLENGNAVLAGGSISLDEALARHKLVVRKGANIHVKHPLSFRRLPRRAEYGLIIDGPVETGPAARVSAIMRSLRGECLESCGARLCIEDGGVRIWVEGVAHKGSVEIPLVDSDFVKMPLLARLYALYIDAVYSLLTACSRVEDETSLNKYPLVVEALHGPRIVWGVVHGEYVYTLPSMYNIYSTFSELGLEPPFASIARAICVDDLRSYADSLLIAVSLLSHCGKVKILVKRGARVLTKSLEPPRVQHGGIR